MSGLSQQELLKRIMEINKDPNLSDAEKAAARQDLMSGKWKEKLAPSSEDTAKQGKGERRRSAAPGGCHRLRIARTCSSPPAPFAAPCLLLPLDDHRGSLHPFAEDKGKGAAGEKEEGSSALDDDTLKCAICFDLCVRPVTVRWMSAPRMHRQMSAFGDA